MTWLTGTTTWGRLDAELTELMCGERASNGNGATVAESDRWVRDEVRTITGTISFSGTSMTDSAGGFTAADVGLMVINDNVPSAYVAAFVSAGEVTLSAAATSATSQTVKLTTNTVRSHPDLDQGTGWCYTRSGFFGNTAGWDDATSIQVTSPYTSVPSSWGANGRWATRITITGANTVAGDYSTVTATYQQFNLDTALAVPSSGSTIAFNSSGVSTTSISGLQVLISNPSGFATPGAHWRGFTSTYMYGVDPWPMLYRASGSVSFTGSVDGTAGTDWDVVTEVYGATNSMNSIGSGSFDRSNLLHGRGIKTATGLGSGSLYGYAFTMAYAKARIFRSATAGRLSIDIGGSRRDTSAAAGSLLNMRCVGGYRITDWARMFETPGSVSNSSVIQYFLSITRAGIVLVLNGDSASTGKLGTAWLGHIAATSTVDAFPVGNSSTFVDWTSATTAANGIPGIQYSFASVAGRQNGAWGSRDWQTSWASCGHWQSVALCGAGRTDVTGYPRETANESAQTALYPIGFDVVGTTSVAASNQASLGIPARQTKPGHDSKWWLYKYVFSQGAFNATNVTSSTDRIVRGDTSRFYFIPDDNWTSGDELTDTVTGTKYLLLKPDYAGIGYRLRSGAGVFWGGIAIAEV